MRIRSALSKDRDLGDAQTMTPMIDIVFLLLVFFVCVATDQVIEYSLPTELNAGSVDVAATEPQDNWVTEIRLNLIQPPGETAAVVEMNGRQFADYAVFQNTLSAVADVSRESPVILDIAENVRLGDMIKVYDACRAAEFTSINFAMKQSELKPNR